MTDEGSELYAVLRSIVEDHKDQPAMNPIWLANQAMQQIGFARKLHDIGWIGCNLQFRQIARVLLRKHFDPAEFPEQDDLFSGTLQQRYPLPRDRDEDPTYVLLELLSKDDAQYNVLRMRKAASAIQRHADALEIWTRRKFGRVA